MNLLHMDTSDRSLLINDINEMRKFYIDKRDNRVSS